MWLAGCWSGQDGSAAQGAFEAWTVPRAGRMFGVSQTVRGARSTFEYMRIEATEAGVRFIPQPNGVPPVEFSAITSAPMRDVFYNPTHDFPKYVEYARDGDTLTARIGNVEPGAEGRRQVFVFRRTSCETVFGKQ